ncbi:hypothetical protein P8452_47388 [Trifolium repens]|nr:hypothetical protein P8452_47388 [Trifolium repens]
MLEFINHLINLLARHQLLKIACQLKRSTCSELIICLSLLSLSCNHTCLQQRVEWLSMLISCLLIKVSKEFSKEETNHLKQNRLCHIRMLALGSIEETVPMLYQSMFLTAGILCAENLERYSLPCRTRAGNPRL